MVACTHVKNEALTSFRDSPSSYQSNLPPRLEYGGERDSTVAALTATRIARRLSNHDSTMLHTTVMHPFGDGHHWSTCCRVVL